MVARTKSRIACFTGPSFHDGSKLPEVTVCAGAETGRSVGDKAGSAARVESRTRRFMPMIDFKPTPMQLIAGRGFPPGHPPGRTAFRKIASCRPQDSWSDG